MGFDPCPNHSSNNPKRPTRAAHVNNKNNSLNVIRSMEANSAVSLLPVRSLSLPSFQRRNLRLREGSGPPEASHLEPVPPEACVCVSEGGVRAQWRRHHSLGTLIRSWEGWLGRGSLIAFITGPVAGTANWNSVCRAVGV